MRYAFDLDHYKLVCLNDGYSIFLASVVSGVSLRRSADNTQAPASFVVQTDIVEFVVAAVFVCNEDVATIASVLSSMDANVSFVLNVSSATQSDCVRTRTSKAVSMLYVIGPDR